MRKYLPFAGKKELIKVLEELNKEGNELWEKKCARLKSASEVPAMTDQYRDRSDTSSPKPLSSKTRTSRAQEAYPFTSAPPEVQAIHERIDAVPGLSDTSKCVLKLVAYIPEGQSTSYRGIRNNMHMTYRNTSMVHVTAALRKCPFDLDEVPAHHVVKQNGGIGFLGCD
ncbi:hypothetical protein P154DRAFT_586442 [Amniculicola lignicola CBS 123094]|uniref:Methylated-DNA-[protein]-cysteine S-methyltransferase DNA binding domain-containing protein n=1 Tax=Amniculicola lignicola CBS 123094 TaxID=1392246 RepID=A0A6A5WSE0_9PLEO|nr:hypothetical protein P154DRAFT_586442 [Amniculicola lignicola CBS 123094]